MSERAVADQSRMTDTPQTSGISVDNPVEMQRGYIAKNGFFGNMSLSASFGTFGAAASTAATGYSGYVQNHELKLTEAQYILLTKIADSISRQFPINYEAIRDFLIILCCIDRFKDLQLIAAAVEFPELDNEYLLGNPDGILALPKLFKIAYMANAVDGILKLYSRYSKLRQKVSSDPSYGMGDILASLSIGLGSAGTFRIESPVASDTMGNFLSELVTGTRVPMTVLAKNPNLAPPTYVGMSFCGESPHALSNVDITQPFARKIAAFPVPSNGAASTMFSLQNSSSMSGSQSIEGIVASVMFGSSTITPGSSKELTVGLTVGQLSISTGVAVGETMEPSRADVAIPLMMGLSMCQSGGLTQPIFGSNTFQGGWTLSCSIGNHMMATDPNFLTAYRSMG